MAKYIAQIIITGTQVIGRAFARALKQEYEASQQAAQRYTSGGAAGGKTRSERLANQKLGMSLDEAKQILNVRELSKEEVERRYEALFKANEAVKTNGGSALYLLSKIVRAKERIDHELKSQSGSDSGNSSRKSSQNREQSDEKT